MSDWGAVNDRIESLRAGMDLEMPGYIGDGEKQIIDAVREGRLPIQELDNCARRMLLLVARCSSADRRQKAELRQEHRDVAERAACEGIVLLKNDGGLLPLNRKGTIALIGEFAKKPRYQGAGSSLVTPLAVENAYDAIVSRAGDELEILFAPGYREDSLKPDKALLAEAKKAATKADMVIIFCGLPAILETEGIDRRDLRMPESHECLVEEVLSVNRNAVLVLMNGGPLEMPWAGAVPCILEAYLGGQSGGNAIARILFGEENPSGKLAETFPVRWKDNPASRFFPGGRESVEYREGTLVGYRYYDAAGCDVLFPFGHGLSYTEFSYEGLSLKEENSDGHISIDVSFTIRNTGKRQGKEGAQVYVKKTGSSSKNHQRGLAAFAKIALAPGESKPVSLSVDELELSCWNTKEGRWIAAGGTYEIQVGSSSRDIRLKGMIDIRGFPKCEVGEEKSADYFGALAEGDKGKKAFEAIIGSELPSGNKVQRGRYTLDTPLCDMEGFLAALLRFLLRSAAMIAMAGNRHNPTVAAIGKILMEAPLRKFTFFTNGAVKNPFLEGLLALLNFRLF